MKIHPHVTVMLSILMLVGLLGACAPATVSPAQPPAETQPSTAAQPTVSEVKTEKPFGEGKRVAVVFAYGGLGDKSFNDSLFSGMVLASSRMGFAWDYVEPMAAAEYEPMLRNYAESGIYDLVICNGGSCGSSLSTVATDYPQQLFMGDDCVVDLPNVATYNFRTDELAYLVGIVAGSMTKSSKIGFIGGMDADPKGEPIPDLRRLVFESFLAGKGLFRPEWVRTGEYSPKNGYLMLKELFSLPERPTAVFISSDAMAIGCYKAMHELELRIPEDVSLMGFNDIAQARYMVPPLSSVRIHTDFMGETAVELIEEWLRTGRKINKKVLIPTKLVARESTGPASAD